MGTSLRRKITRAVMVSNEEVLRQTASELLEGIGHGPTDTVLVFARAFELAQARVRLAYGAGLGDAARIHKWLYWIDSVRASCRRVCAQAHGKDGAELFGEVLNELKWDESDIDCVHVLAALLAGYQV